MAFLEETGIVSYYRPLFPFGGFADDSQGILANIQWGAFMSGESGCDLGLCIGQVGQNRRKLGVAAFTDGEDWRRFSHEAEFSHRHETSLPLLRRGQVPPGFQTAPLPRFAKPQHYGKGKP